MTGQNRKSYKKDAEYLKQRVTELVDENDKLQVQIRNLQSSKSPSVENNKSELEDANNSKGNGGVAKPEQSASNDLEGEKSPHNYPTGQSMGKTPIVQPQAPQEQKNTLQIEEEPEPAEIPKPTIAIGKEDYSFECPECHKQFNELNDGCCPYCDAELEDEY